MNKIKDIQLSEKTLSEMEMDDILGGHSDESSAIYNCFQGNCAAGCSGHGGGQDQGNGIPV